MLLLVVYSMGELSRLQRSACSDQSNSLLVKATMSVVKLAPQCTPWAGCSAAAAVVVDRAEARTRASMRAGKQSEMVDSNVARSATWRSAALPSSGYALCKEAYVRRAETDVLPCTVHHVFCPAAKLGNVKENLTLLKVFNMVQSLITASVRRLLMCLQQSCNRLLLPAACAPAVLVRWQFPAAEALCLLLTSNFALCI